MVEARSTRNASSQSSPQKQPPSASTPLLGTSTPDSNRSRTSTLHLSHHDYLSLASDSPHTLRSRSRTALLAISFTQATLACLCAGSIAAFSLYGPLFQTHLHYTQYAVNGISISAELGMYLPVPLWGLVCDRYNTRLVSVLSGLCFGAGYGLGGIAYSRALGPATMIVSFVAIGLGTSGMYLSAVSTCAKNFGRGSWRGISLSVPIAAFGLSGLWISIVGSRFFTPEGGDLDVGRYFTFLACLMTVVGIIGGLTLQVMDEGKVMDDQSSISTGSALLGEDPSSDGYYSRGYGATNTQEPRSLEFSISAHASSSKHASVVSSPISKAEEDPLAPEIQQKDPNEKTRLFFTDHTMWLLSAGFFLVAGVGDAYQNNIGSIVLSLPSDMAGLSPHGSGVATQVMTIALTSTFARLFTGTMSDYLAPSEPEPLFAADVPLHERKRSKLEVSRVAFLLMFSVIHATGYLILASSYFENHPQLVTLSSGLVGLGYGAAFSLVPIIISVVWGVDNFATNWGFVAMFPAGGALVWSAVYATVYERFKQEGSDACMGYNCYGFTAWGWFLSVIAAIILWTWVWRGRGGWYQRETVV